MTTEYLKGRRVQRSAWAITEGTPMASYMGQCETHRVPVREDVTPAQATTKHRMITCFVGGPAHEHLIQGERLFGVITALECDGSCRGARGVACSCGCGGVNHGNTWTRGKFISARTEVESAIEKYRAELARREEQRIKRAEKRAAAERAEFDTWATDPKIAAMLAWLAGAHAYVGNFLGDMITKAERHEILSENMISALRSVWTDEKRRAHEAAQVAARRTPATDAPPKAGAGDQATLTPGVYKLASHIYVVKGNRAYAAWRKDLHAALKAEKAAPARPSDAFLYAKELVESPPRMTEAGTEIPFTLAYAPGIIRRLALTDMMPRAEAEELSTRYARCIVCGRHLKAAKSVREGIGPVCGAYFRD